MAAYTQEEILHICNQYKPAILRQVGHYYNTQFPMISSEDLLQAGIEAVLIYLKKHQEGTPICFPTLDVKERILFEIQKSLPLSYGHNKRLLPQHISTAQPTLAIQEELLGSESEDELVFQSDVKAFLRTLTRQERQVFELVAMGYKWEEAGRMVGIPRSSVYNMRSKIKKRYDQMMR